MPFCIKRLDCGGFNPAYIKCQSEMGNTHNCFTEATKGQAVLSSSTNGLNAETLQRVTTLAMEKAVLLGMVPCFSSQEEYLMHWDNMTEVVKTILSAE